MCAGARFPGIEPGVGAPTPALTRLGRVPTSPRAAADSASPRTVAVWSALEPVLTAGTLRVLDVGGGSGTLAVPLAQSGHDVTVVDPSADALATLRRRAAAAGVGERVRGVQGDGGLLHEVRPGTAGAAGGGFDLALCHSVLEVVDDPATTLREIAGAVRAGGTVSVAA